VVEKVKPEQKKVSPVMPDVEAALARARVIHLLAKRNRRGIAIGDAAPEDECDGDYAHFTSVTD
jgi:hypothetical protein